MKRPDQDDVARTPLGYAKPDPSPRNGRVALAVALWCGPPLLWALFKLQRLPYRPPVDMSRFLGGAEIVAVRLLIGVIAVFWVAGLFWFIGSRARKCRCLLPCH